MSAFLSLLKMFTYINMFGARFHTMMPSRTTSGGSRKDTAFTRFSTFTVAWLGSDPMWKNTWITASPELAALDTMYFMFCTPLIDCSSGMRQDSSRTFALAPG